MTKPKLESESGQDIFYLCSKVDGEWYSTITAKLKAEGAEPLVAIAGPFADAEETTAYNDRRRELVDQRGKLYLTDMASVPAKIRQTLTDDVLRGWRQDDFKRRGTRRGYSPINLDPKN